jgi:galactosamine-6-phosphate isomerase
MRAFFISTISQNVFQFYDYCIFMPMHISFLKDSTTLAVMASSAIADAILQKPGLLLCAATGNSPTETYKALISQKANFDSSQLRVIKLDEWGGVSMDGPQTCEQYLEHNLVKPLNISAERYFAFESNSENPENEVTRMQAILSANGPIDVCILGLGLNGHIAFNEPAEQLEPNCHIASLSKQSMQHSMASEMHNKPTYGLTLGMADILQSKLIIMLVSGQNKKDIIAKFLSKKITSQVPASFLWLHKNVQCFIDEQIV